MRALASSATSAGVRFPIVCWWFSSMFREFFSRYSGFPSSLITNTSIFLFYQVTANEEPLCGNATANSIYIHLIYVYLYLTQYTQRGVDWQKECWFKGNQNGANKEAQGKLRKENKSGLIREFSSVLLPPQLVTLFIRDSQCLPPHKTRS